MEEQIKSLAQILHPTEEEIRNGKEKMNEIFRLLQQKSRYSIDRCKLVGGTAKKTSIKGHIDFDCVVFVNDGESIKAISDEFEQVLIRSLGSCIENMKRTGSYSTLQFTYKGVKFDVCVAKNRANDLGNGENADEEQAISILVSFKRNNGIPSKQEMYKISPGLSHLAVKFLKKQSAFAHEIARLAKYWNKTLILAENVSGRSSIMEFIAIAAANEEEKSNGQASYLNTFKRFLQKVHDIQRLKLSFHENEQYIPNGFKPSRCHYIIDPANPYHDYLGDVKIRSLEKFSKYAQVTLERLKSWNGTSISQVFVEQ